MHLPAVDKCPDHRTTLWSAAASHRYDSCPPLPDVLPSASRATLAKQSLIKNPKSQGQIILKEVHRQSRQKTDISGVLAESGCFEVAIRAQADCDPKVARRGQTWQTN